MGLEPPSAPIQSLQIMDIDLQACATGDPEAWNVFVNETAGLVLAAVRRTAGKQLDHPQMPDIDDVVQAIYVRLLANDGRLMLKYDPERAAVSTWLTLISRSVTIDVLRRKRLPQVPLADHDRPGQEPNTPVRESGSLESVAPMQVLTGRQHLVLTLLFEDGRTVAEAAQFLGVGEQTVRSTKHKALERLRKHMGAELGGQEE